GTNFKPSLRIGNYSMQVYEDTPYIKFDNLVWSWTQSNAIPQCTTVNITYTIVGRWVVLQNPGEQLQVTEIQVFGIRGDFVDSLPNLAFGRPAYSSSVYQQKNYVPSVAVDGVTHYQFGEDPNFPQFFCSDTTD
ncbi:hypothetical protein VaNZ11_012810, partial [Volvox africanus]